MKKLFPALAVAVLALVGCSAADSAPEPSAPVESSPAAVESAEPTPEAAETAAPAADPRQAWADSQLDILIETAGANSLNAWPEGSPERNIKSVDSPDKGVFRITVADADYGEFDLDGLASSYMYRVGCAADDVEKVVVETESKSDSASSANCT